MTSERDTPAAKGNGRDWSETLFLPKTEFPMRGGLPDLRISVTQRANEFVCREVREKPGPCLVERVAPRAGGPAWRFKQRERRQ